MFEMMDYEEYNFNLTAMEASSFEGSSTGQSCSRNMIDVIHTGDYCHISDAKYGQCLLTCKRATARSTKDDRGARDTGLQFEDATSATGALSHHLQTRFVHLLSGQFPHVITTTRLDIHTLAK
jgi:hypothetical protein